MSVNDPGQVTVEQERRFTSLGHAVALHATELSVGNRTFDPDRVVEAARKFEAFLADDDGSGDNAETPPPVAQDGEGPDA